MKTKYYKVYEVSKAYPRGKYIKGYKTKKLAEKCMNACIYRFIREDVILSGTL